MKHVKQPISAILIIIMGLIVLMYGVIVEDEPTVVALLLIILGTGWYFIRRAQLRSQLQ
jgi:hypothetical protein